MLAANLENWFARVKRPMPWRRRPSPYVCWISEIMMQQTTYAAVLPYYERFLKKFPTVEKLAAAQEGEVLKAWEGLGYYARARNLLKAARQIVSAAGTAPPRDRACSRGGLSTSEAAAKRSLEWCVSPAQGVRGDIRWPSTSAEWSQIPGVGPYTAAALSSVLDGERVPVVDGNVARVFARVWKLTDDFSKLPARAKLAERLQAEIDKCRVPGDFNQAMMELGALVCTPKSPDCKRCPLAKMCAARKDCSWADYPVRKGKKELPVRKVTSVIVRDAKGRVLLVQNREGGLLKGLWELPTVEVAADVTQVFSHFRLEQENFKAVRTDAEFRDPKSVPLTTATRKALGGIEDPVGRALRVRRNRVRG